MSTEKKESTLTAPSDRDRENKFKLDVSSPPLTAEEAKEAFKALNNTTFVERFPAVERRYADPPVELQKIGLISFVPAKGATPNEQGIYGFAKLRGNFATDVEANARAEQLVQTDSYHQIYHTYVGRPFPLTLSSDFSKEVNRVELRKATADAIEDDLRKKRKDEEREIEEIKQRERNLLEDVKKTEEHKDDAYTTLRVKKAQLTWTYLETEKKMKQMTGLISKARKEIEEMDEKDPVLKDNYLNKYMEARRQTGLPTDRTDDSFMKYLVEDVSIPEVEAEYQRLFGPGAKTSSPEDAKESD